MQHEEFENASIKYSRPPFHRSQRDGFTLLEIIIVLIIIGISAALVGIMVGTGSSRLEFRSLAKDMSATLRYARNHAVSEKKTYCFVMNIDEGMYRLYSDKRDDDGKYIPVMSREIPDDIQIVTDEEDEELYQLEFFPQGNSSGGVIELRRQKGSSLFIRINRITGKIEVVGAEE